MDETTRAYLRNAALEALTQADDNAALELLSLMAGETAQPRQLEAAPQIRDGRAHDYHFWTSFLRDNFLPFMVNHGRTSFTSPELISWLTAHPNLPLNSGDLILSGDRETWKAQITNALRKLKDMGCLSAGRFGRVYQINPLQLTAAKEA